MTLRPLAAVAALALLLSLGVQGVADAAPDRHGISAPAIGMKARIVKVGGCGKSFPVGTDPRVLYTCRHGDPPCDPIGTTVYAWRSGNGVADRWGSLKKGDRMRVAGCRFRVTKVRYWKESKTIGHLFRVDGPARVVLIGCKVNDYSKRTMVFARRV